MGLEELKTSIGMLLCAGWTLDDVLDMTLEQIGCVVESGMLSKAEGANYVMEAVSTALGGKVKKKSKVQGKSGRNRTDSGADISAAKLSPGELDIALKDLGL